MDTSGTSSLQRHARCPSIPFPGITVADLFKHLEKEIWTIHKNSHVLARRNEREREDYRRKRERVVSAKRQAAGKIKVAALSEWKQAFSAACKALKGEAVNDMSPRRGVLRQGWWVV